VQTAIAIQAQLDINAVQSVADSIIKISPEAASMKDNNNGYRDCHDGLPVVDGKPYGPE
jgi:hypothetical protein